LSMLYVPICLSLMILLPSRNVYFFGVILIFLGYFLSEQIGSFYATLKLPGGFIRHRISPRIEPALNRYRKFRDRFCQWLEVS
jgi:hypothetical protein